MLASQKSSVIANDELVTQRANAIASTSNEIKTD